MADRRMMEGIREAFGFSDRQALAEWAEAEKQADRSKPDEREYEELVKKIEAEECKTLDR